MHHFFVAPSQITEKEIIVEGTDVNHITNVLRMEKGEEVQVSDGQGGQVYRCEIASFEEDTVRLNILEILKDGMELPSKIYLFQGLPKSDKMELIIQKAVELGAYEVIPVAMKRCVVRLDDKKAASKCKRWQTIAESAAKQSKRGIIPKVHDVLSVEEALAYAENMQVKMLPYELATGMEATKELIASIRPGDSVAVWIGPEGGFDEKEVRLASEHGFQAISLGKRILRTETAGMTVLSILMYQMETAMPDSDA